MQNSRLERGRASSKSDGPSASRFIRFCFLFPHGRPGRWTGSRPGLPDCSSCRPCVLHLYGAFRSLQLETHVPVTLPSESKPVGRRPRRVRLEACGLHCTDRSHLSPSSPGERRAGPAGLIRPSRCLQLLPRGPLPTGSTGCGPTTPSRHRVAALGGPLSSPPPAEHFAVLRATGSVRYQLEIPSVKRTSARSL